MFSIILFYIACFWIGFLICIPIGPVNLEIFNTALKKQYPQAVAVAIGASLGDAWWALLAFFGISPFSKSHTMEAIFFLATAAITLVLGLVIIKDSKLFENVEKKEEEIVIKIRRKRWAFLKGLTLVLVNPLGIVTWMICLQFLKKMKIFIPMQLNYEIIFFFVVSAGATSYFLLIVFITNKMKDIFNPRRTAKITRFLGYLLFVFSAFFIFNAIKAFFFNSSMMPPL
ncbi:MAG: LysE family transporter [Candidatus Aminicenantes bacterium]|nr:LysE family transporter [Candidatus Aminicenantes bacterium]